MNKTQKIVDPINWKTNKLVFGSSILGMHFIENSTFGKILKLFIRSDYAEKNCVWLVF